MKKLLFMVGFLALCGVSFSMGLVTDVSAATQTSIVDRLFTGAGVTPPKDLSAEAVSQLASAPDTPFQHLYLFSYKTVKERPSKNALTVLAGQSLGYSQKELEQIFLANDQAPVRNHLKGSLDQESLWAELNRLNGAYQRELQFQKETLQLDYHALAQEMFFNNDLSDSANVDIISDLSLIHMILFKEPLKLPNRSGNAGDVDLASEGPNLSLVDEEDAPVSLATEVSASGPYCSVDSALEAALLEFRKIVNGEGTSETGSDSGASDGVVDIREDAPVVTGPDGSVTLFGPSPTEDAAPNPVADAINDLSPTPIDAFDGLIETFSASKGDWTRPLPCDKIFCIKVNYVKGDVGADDAEDTLGIVLKEKDNCIACHVSFIKQRLQKTLDKPLAPGKVSMNNFEDATCKEAGSKVNLDLNITTIAKPVVLDPGADIVGVPAKHSKDLRTNLEALGSLPTKLEDLPKTQGDIQCDRLLDFESQSGFSSNLTEALSACQLANAEKHAEIQNAFDRFVAQTQADNDGLWYDQMMSELTSLLTHLSNMRDSLVDSYSVENAPLPSLVAKPYCE